MNGRTTFVVLLLGVCAIVYFLAPTHSTHSLAPVKPLLSVAQSRSVFPNSVHASHKVQGPPTVTASFIDRVLTRAGSPAQGIGQVMVQEGVKYGIDPVYALAFFHHESSFGLAGVARSTHSIGNIRCTQGYSCDPTGGYRSYSSYSVAVDDWYILIKAYGVHGLHTVETIIPTYAPNADNNNEAAYIASVNADVAMWRGREVVMSEDLVHGSLATFSYASKYAQSELEDVLIANQRACIIDTRFTPWCNWSKTWTRPFLEGWYRKRYRYAGHVLGNINYATPNAPIVLANEAVGILWLVAGLEQGVTLILLCGCATYERCHRKVIYDKVKDVLGDRLPEYALGQRVMTPNGAGVIDASIPLHVQVMRNRFAVMLDVWQPTRYYSPYQLQPFTFTQTTFVETHSYLHEHVG